MHSIMDVATVARSCFKNNAHEMMMLMVMPCYDHAQMMLKCKANTWVVTFTTNTSVSTTLTLRILLQSRSHQDQSTQKRVANLKNNRDKLLT
jgi:hypothetical protein